MDDLIMERNTRNLPDLPMGKEFDIFVCYCKENLTDVHVMVEHLEKTGLKCCYHERDFEPGKDILSNMNESIQKSTHMLVVLSEDFSNSVFCKHEVNQGLHQVITDGYSIIPIKIEPCEVPGVLKRITYIDAEECDPHDMHTKIIDAIMKTGGSAYTTEKKNGERISFGLKKKERKCLSLIRYEFKLAAEDKERIWMANYQLSVDRLDEIERTINKSILVKYHHVLGAFHRLTTLVFFILGLLNAVVLSILFVTLFGRDPTSNQHGRIAMWIVVSVFCVIGIAWLVCMCRIGCGRITSNIRIKAWVRITNKLWRINKHARVLKLIVLFDLERKFEKRCERNESLQNRRLPDEPLEESTDRMFNIFLRSMKIHYLNRATSGYTRHCMKNGAKCLCVLAEEHHNLYT